MLRMGVAPCSPFSVTERLLREAAALARDLGVRMLTPVSERLDEDTFCRSRYDCTPAEYADSLGWLGDDVWLAHCVHVDEAAAKRFGDSGTAVAHCPTSNARLGAGLAPVAALRAAGVAVGLGVDGSASNEECSLAAELHAAVMVARLREGPAAMTARDALALGTIGGARVLGRADEIGSIEAGKLADLALWRVDGLGHAGCEDPVAALVLGSRPPLALLLVGGDPVVADDVLLTADEDALAGRAAAATRRLLARSRR
jgi:cytosine/adenosine deaminase-related metal-dependent hydrolase